MSLPFVHLSLNTVCQVLVGLDELTIRKTSSATNVPKSRTTIKLERRMIGESTFSEFKLTLSEQRNDLLYIKKTVAC